MYKKAASFVAVLLCLSVVSIAYAGFKEGTEAYTKGEYARAYGEFKPLAEQGNAETQWYLGVMRHDGQGVSRDYTEALKWFRKAAEQGYAKAEYNLGVMYRKGEGVQRDYAEAVKWYRQAAERGLGAAQLNLGVMYAQGQGVRQDLVQAYEWFDLAASLGDSVGIRNRDAVAAKMTPSQIAKAQRMASELKAGGINH